MQKILYAIPDLCTGCNRCVYVCSAVKEGKFIPSKSRIHINNFSFNGYSVPSVCFQCPKHVQKRRYTKIKTKPFWLIVKNAMDVATV